MCNWEELCNSSRPMGENNTPTHDFHISIAMLLTSLSMNTKNSVLCVVKLITRTMILLIVQFTSFCSRSYLRAQESPYMSYIPSPTLRSSPNVAREVSQALNQHTRESFHLIMVNKMHRAAQCTHFLQQPQECYC